MKKNIIYIRKLDEESVTEEEYLANKKAHKKKIVYEYKQKNDDAILTEEEFNKMIK